MTDNPFIGKLFHLSFLIKRPVTLGVRIIAQNDQDEVLLVKHSYISGWYLPGGGVEKGDSAEQTAHKELLEETGYKTNSVMEFFGIYLNKRASKRDHVLVYTCRDMECVNLFKANWEIAEMGFFKLDALPENISGGSKRRLDEYFNAQEKSQYW